MDLTEDEEQTIKRALRDRNAPASDRMAAAEYAGDAIEMDEELAGLLLAVVGNSEEPEALRGRAAIALGPVLEECDIEGFDEAWSEPPIEEETFNRIQETLRRVHDDESAPKEVRRRALEASVRSAQDWHKDAIRAAYARPDRGWQLTAVFCMGWIPGFDKEIVKMLDNRDPEIHCEAVRAAGERGVTAAWPHVAELISSGRKIDKDLLLAAIEASGSINPEEAPRLLSRFTHSKDEDIAAAVSEALMNAEASIDPDLEEDDEEDEEDEDEE